jgi:sulfur dioxygenase
VTPPRDDLVFAQLNDGACRTYLVGSKTGREAALVDPVLGSTGRYLEVLKAGGWSLRFVIDTHTHADHLSGGRLLAERTGAEYAMHRRAGARHVAHRLSDGSTLRLGASVIEAVETPGHTKDSLTLKLAGRVLTGDWLFIGGAGRTDLPGGDPGEHWDSLTRVIPSLDESTLVFPGHDYRGLSDSALHEEKRTNPNLRPRTREEYVAWLCGATRPTPPWMVETLRLNNEGPVDPALVLAPEDAVSACMCQPASPAGIRELSVDEVKARLDAGPDPRRLLLDVRQSDEYEGELGHVPGAVLVPLPELPARLVEIDSHRDGTVVAICRSGARSAKAARILRGAGFRDVWNMAGGTLAWRRRGFPVER